MPYLTSGVTCAYSSPLGPMTLAATPQGLCGLWFDGQKHQPLLSHWRQDADNPHLRDTITWLTHYFDGPTLPPPSPLLDLQAGSPFQQAVWRALLNIPQGQTQSYGELARQLGRPLAARAVGAAVGRNPVSIIVPCHRVVGSSGALTGYAGGLHRKTALLRLEGLT